ncbi:uncharacterized protein (TIGR00369 family) [Balneicella halophila]|uniref:dihydrofolate reductase n=1 Tax=Balneicella halophila TaxID=1537566 RepID=A0A7L4UQ24_BALHA|nr:dihydrofolate reductase [Balneicella halophila]PVX50906.1 uncharacterized protein (TIGR00369 family) [Balneicella halophila]
MKLAIIVAIAENNAIGKDNDLLWHLPGDLKRFKQITTGHSIIMGRKTFESIGKPLPNRRSIVITNNKDYKAEGVTVVHSISEALEVTKNEDEVFIIGGGKIYDLTLPLVHRMYLTIVHETFNADTFFPKIHMSDWNILEQEELPQNEKNPYKATFYKLERKASGQIITKEQLQTLCKNTMVSHLGIEYTDVNTQSVTARMPVDERTLQPFGYLHGGASLALLETVGSALTVINTDTAQHNVFGMAVNANHVKPAKQGYVYATATFLHKGTKTQVVNVKITSEKGELVCDGRITNIIFPK